MFRTSNRANCAVRSGPTPYKVDTSWAKPEALDEGGGERVILWKHNGQAPKSEARTNALGCDSKWNRNVFAMHPGAFLQWRQSRGGICFERALEGVAVSQPGGGIS